MWTPVRTADGSWSLVSARHGQACHSLSGAWQQARERYAGPCRLRELALERGSVRLLDIGTGLGLNLAAARAALAGTSATLHAVTFELDRSVIEAAAGLRDWPADVERHLAPVRDALRASLDGRAPEWDLRLELGDARSRLTELDSTPFDAVFLDPFSPQVDGALWGVGFLSEIARRMAPEALLSTYSASLGVRAALAAAGLRVGLGPRVGTKSEGTLASPGGALPALPERTQRRVERRARQAAGGDI